MCLLLLFAIQNTAAIVSKLNVLTANSLFFFSFFCIGQRDWHEKL